ncbi:hypothetical protein K2F40_05510 [Clostridium sp. CM028]|uniref:hypothetical protein n=1 Tax=Clostridium sp. CM028 TaxID=2851575 RepID=UPI001C6E0B10|nr:hypothetical protein [Clostridium sp. CM028]MBW9148430.1 hypothetical protein [Clostridium sp. CM028]WLC61003.1 hypothetical protein KTC94_12910 [Clostridium sp. CM028]
MYTIYKENVGVFAMKEKYLVLINRGYDKEDIFYMGDSIIIAYKRLKELPYANKEILFANVKMVTMFNKYELIESYDVIKKIS